MRPLFPDRVAEGTRFFKDHGYIPANHAYIIRGDVYREHPWLAFNLYKAFLEAKMAVDRNISERVPASLILRREYLNMTREIFGPDPVPYGVKENRDMLQTIIDFSFEQGLTKKKATIEELFAPSTLDL